MWQPQGEGAKCVQDFFPENGGKELAPFMKRLGMKRKVTLPGVTSDSFNFTLSFSGDRKPCCLKSDKIATFEVSGLNAVNDRYGEPGKVALHFEVDENGMLMFLQADSTINVEETIQVDKMVPDEDAGARYCPPLSALCSCLRAGTSCTSSQAEHCWL